MPSLHIIKIKKYSVLLSLLSMCWLQISFADKGYPAPPGHYGAAGLFKEIPVITPDITTTVISPKATNQKVLTETIETKSELPSTEIEMKISTQEDVPATLAMPKIKQTKTPTKTLFPAAPTEVIEKTEPPRAKEIEKTELIFARDLPKTEVPSPTQYQQTYPNAFELQKSYQQAKKLPFSQWGDIPKQTYQSNNPNDYGSNSVPINRTQNRSYPPVMNPPSNYMPYPNMPYPNIPRSLNYIPGDINSMGFNPGNTMNQLRPNSGNFMPPANPYLKQFNQFPVPQNVYGTTPKNIQNDPRYMKRIPAEEIIYPPSYPGRR